MFSLSYLDSLYDRKVSGHTTAFLWGAASRICSGQLAASLCCSDLVFFFFFFFFNHFVQVVQPYSSTDTATAWKNSYFILSKRSDF